MKICAMCGKKVMIDEHFNRRSTCPSCGEELHICLNCRNYSESSRQWCQEPRAELPRTRDKANFCDWFRYSEGSRGAGASGGSKDEAKRKFEDLFKK